MHATLDRLTQSLKRPKVVRVALVLAVLAGAGSSAVGLHGSPETKSSFVTAADVAERSVPRAARSLARPVPPPSVRVHADGRTRVVTGRALSLGEVLTRAGVRPDRDDIVEVTSDTGGPSLAAGGVVRVVDVEVTTSTSRSKVQHRSRTVRDPHLLRGSERVVTQGRDGWVRRTVRTTRHDGAVVARRTVATKRQAAVTRVVAVGTRRPTPRPVSSGRVNLPAGEQNWAALAQCESSGNPRAVSADGLYHGLFQFDVRTFASVGGSGIPSQASPAEQLKRAKILFAQRGAQPWPVCGKLL